MYKKKRVDKTISEKKLREMQKTSTNRILF